jgi:hypothetical protein
MKLTKGKIAKLYNKRKQTLKKKGKPKRGAGKSRTFRQNKKVNLSRRSLKRFSYLGGQLAPNGLPVIKRGLDNGLSAADAGLSASNELASNVPLVVPGSVEARAGISGVQEGVELAKSVIPEPIADTDEQLASTEEPIDGPETSEQPVETELPEPAAPLGEEVALAEEQVIPPVIEPELPKQMVEPELIEPELAKQTIEPELIEPVVNQELSEEPQKVAPSDQQNTVLNDAVKTIVNEIAKQVESKLTDEAPTDDGFKAFTGAVGKMGGKRRNTRRFKLVKNKTKRAAA